MLLYFILISILFNFSDVQVKEGDHANTLIVKVTNIPNAKGKVIVHLYTSKDNFLEKCVVELIKPAQDGELEFVYENLTKQTYAVMAHHDENDNDDVDAYFFGLPKEHYGFSNDARAVFGPPSFESSNFRLDKQVKMISFKVQ